MLAASSNKAHDVCTVGDGGRDGGKVSAPPSLDTRRWDWEEREEGDERLARVGTAVHAPQLRSSRFAGKLGKRSIQASLCTGRSVTRARCYLYL